MRLFRKTTAREKEIRRSKAERGLAWYRRLLARVRWQPLAFLVVCAGVTAAIIAGGQDRLDLRVGQRVPRASTSRVRFSVADEAQTRAMRVRARDNAPVYYALDSSLIEDIRNRLTSALSLARQHATEPQEVRAERLHESAGAIKVELDPEGRIELIRLADLPDSDEYQRAVDRAAQKLQQQPFVEPADLAGRRTGPTAILVDTDGAAGLEVPTNRLLYANDAQNAARVADAAAGEFPPPLRASVRASLLLMLQGERPETLKPLYRYDSVRSAKAADDAHAAVPTQYVEYAIGTQLADAGEITRDELDLLHEEARHYEARCGADPVLHTPALLAVAGYALTAFLLVSGVGGYILLRHVPPRGTARRRYTMAAALLLVLLLARATYLEAPAVHLTVGLYAFAVALLAITSTRGTTYATAGLLALLTALATRQGTGFAAVLVVVALVLFLGLRDVRNRGQIIAVGAAAALAAMGTTVLTGLIDGQSVTFALWQQALWAGLTTLAAAFIVEGVLPGIERVFRVTTAMTLLEWCDPNKPLLRLMAAEAPGTYNHSLLVGTLADAAAEAIGANGLLARTGAYYHDIGKINKPEYFVENQAMGGSRHDRLSPAMSHLIIIGHVKDGMAMAKEYGLPAALHCFIPEHHGTGVVEYFYHAANKARKPGDPEVSESEFRYPGPKPQSKETAIVMLCDAVEGAIRAMPEPTPNRIEDTVDRLIQKRLMDGQFDECDLTFRELQIIRTSLVKSLNSIYHGRITYPTDETEASPESRSAS